jgi:hypothetical protein
MRMLTALLCHMPPKQEERVLLGQFLACMQQ